jgi:hypothetical protein
MSSDQKCVIRLEIFSAVHIHGGTPLIQQCYNSENDVYVEFAPAPGSILKEAINSSETLFFWSVLYSTKEIRNKLLRNIANFYYLDTALHSEDYAVDSLARLGITCFNSDLKEL